MSEEALQIAEKRREAKGKGKRERYIHKNAVSKKNKQRDKKHFLSDQCKEIEANNRMGKRDLFKRIRDTKGTFHARMSMIMDRKSKDMKIKKRWQRIHRRMIQKRSYGPDNHDGVVTNLEPDILECEVK